ncbi:LytTR family transcriptional regulator DNA-binding domain-containing protein [Pseudomonas stutzeri]|uniref:LytTR family transcriptional regulator DNA-binding domain-containing protein n=1 Tax=Stutzerimonas stutzeri TaxID=316 RepID=UPI002109B1F7|nr:LytTR family transcriptional regulator DNA-binding domain-containing protein [Stutzerimonas stutzeri]
MNHRVDDRKDLCALAPYEFKNGETIKVDLTKVAGYQASLKYVEALMDDGSLHILATSLAKLQKAHPQLVRVRRDTLVVPEKVQSIARLAADRRREITLAGGWIVTTGRDSSDWRKLDAKGVSLH